VTARPASVLDSSATASASATAAGQGAPAGPLTLAGGELVTRITPRGTGDTRFGAFALTGWAADPVEDREGTLLYLEEPVLARLWSIGAEPVAPRDGVAWCEVHPGHVVLGRDEYDIEARLEVWIDAVLGLELRRVRLVNRGSTERTIRATYAADLVVHDPLAHASHPAFSRLFVSTAWDATEGALFAQRRPRGEDERFPWLVAAALEERAPEFDSSRVSFLGRAPGRDRPRGLVHGTPLAGQTGSVLDPVVALRVTRRIAAGASTEFTFVLGAADSREAARTLVAAARGLGAAGSFARVVAATAEGGDGAPVPRTVVATGEPAAVAATPATPTEGTEATADLADEKLAFWNGYGGFAADGREYVIRLAPDGEGGLLGPPQPWVNVIANERFGTIVSETGAGATWSRNSREWRLTPWSNDPLLDPHGEALYLADTDAGAWFSPLPGPLPAPAPYTVRHGFGRTRFAVRHAGLDVESDVFVPLHESLKVTTVRVRNLGVKPRRLALVSYQRLVLGGAAPGPGEPGAAVVTALEPRSRALLAARAHAEGQAARVAFASVFAIGGTLAPARAFTCDRGAFLGAHGSPRAPGALDDPRAFDGATGAQADPCFAERVEFALAPGEEIALTLLLGDAADADEARETVARARESRRTAVWREEVARHWSELVGAVHVATPLPALDLMANGWLAYQALACRIWARSAFYQSGGAFGFRDQLQDASAFTPHRRDVFRAQIVLHAGHQFVEGDVMHWWHPPEDRGLRTRFADDLVWLPYLTADYVRVTGDTSVLDEPAPFLTAPALEPGEQEAFLAPTAAGESADEYTHCVRALDRALAVGNGVHGLPLFGAGDWNDGMNRVGKDGKGESVWMAFFLGSALADFAPLCEARGDAARAAHYRAVRAELARAVETAAWDGAWYRRGYFDDGAPLGSAQSDECKIDALAQAWAVLSGMAPPDRAAQALAAVESHLVDSAAGLVRLLAPPFEHSAHDPGYIQGYLPGVRENGGQYTHAALWYVRALAEGGRRDRAACVLEMLSPVSHTQTAEQVATYRVEPYVISADVYGVAPHVGHGGWTWYTGSAGWMSRVLLESVLGFREEGGIRYVVRPAVPDTWPGFTASFRRPDGTRYAFTVENPDARAEAVVLATLDGASLTLVGGELHVPIARDGATHRVRVVLGARPLPGAA
jgi:N,N'-diacetylchitobiose phosphorylase